MVLFGTLVNGMAIIVGAWFGIKIKGFSPAMRDTVMKAIGLAVLVLGLTMALEGQYFLITIFSLTLGGVIGERVNIEGKLNEVGNWIERRMKRTGGGKVAEGFVAATLLYVVGAMAIMGAIDSGMRQDHSVLLIKSVLDGFSSIVFAATMGIGVMFSAIPVIIYQGGIALAASVMTKNIPEPIFDVVEIELTAVGGVMIIGIGLNILGLSKIRVANLLPALVIAVILAIVYDIWF